MKCIPSIVLLFLFVTTQGQNKFNAELKRELDSIYTLDQKYRKLLFSDEMKKKSDSIAAFYKVPVNELTGYLMKRMEKTDSSNTVRINMIVEKYGYPGKTVVGTPTNEAVFYVIQHSQFIEKYLKLVKNAANQQELPFKLYAMMLDRALMQKGKKQIYGTQGRGFNTIDKQTGKTEFKTIIWPVKNPKSVNRRREKAGFPNTIEETARRMGIEYKIYTLKDYKNMLKK